MAATSKPTRPKQMANKKRKLEDMSVEEFMMNSDSDDASSEASFSQQPSPAKTKKSKKAAPKSADIEKNSPATKGKKSSTSLKGLKEKDPEFYKFLLKEDKELLEDDDEEEEEDDEEDLDSDDDDDDEEDGENEHFQPPRKLEVASDGEDDDDDDDAGDEDGNDSGSDGEKRSSKKKLITGSMIKAWKQQAQDSPSSELLQQWVLALGAASQNAGLSTEAGESTPYRVDNNAGFNAVMRLCLADLLPLLERLLTLKSMAEQQQVFSKKNKKWRVVRGAVKTYCVSMLQLSGVFSEASMVNAVMRHIHKLVVCYAAFPKLVKVFQKKMVKMWSVGEETTRVLAFLCLNKLVRLHSDVLLDPTLKQMYMAYVNNCKFVSPTSLPVVTFMQRSLVEMYLMQEPLSYQHAFLYIRQLAIHLRNAITLKKKENYQLVYNWQYVLSLGLWTQLLTTAHPSPVLQPLVYPLVQVIIGTIRLLPTATYYPLRFHCVRYLTALSNTAFIPVLPFLLEVLEQTDFNKRQKGGGLKAITMSTILKFSKPQLQEKAFKEAVIDQLCELLFDYLNTQSHTAAFPELIVPLVIQLKDFTKKCKVAALCRPVKQVVDKAEEAAKVIEARRRSTAFNLADGKAVELWESKNKEEGTPLSKFYVSWRKMLDRRRQQEITAKDQVTTAAERMVTEMKRTPQAPHKASEEEKDDFDKLFGTGDDDDDDDDEEDDTFSFMPKDEKRKQDQQQQQQLDSDEDDYSDFDSDDLEQLAKSGSEEEDSDDDEEKDDDDSEEEQEEEEKTKDVKKQEKAQSPKGKKQRQRPQKKAPARSRPKLQIENDQGDIVQDFSLSDSD